MRRAVLKLLSGLAIGAIGLAMALGGSATAKAPPKQSNDYSAQMAAVSAGASLPGDENLACDQIQAQMAAAVQDPGLKSNATALGAQAQQIQSQAQQKEAELAAQAAAQSAASAAAATAGALVPGLNLLTAGAQQAQTQARAAHLHYGPWRTGLIPPAGVRGAAGERTATEDPHSD